jgi:SAM-dependent methyltransferase
MRDDRERWEERHARGSEVGTPSAFVVAQLDRVREPARRQRALDLACGSGRHTAALTAAGFDTVALDASPTAVHRVTKALGVRGVVADAAHLPFRAATFDLIVKTCFLDRGAFADIARSLAPGGHLVAETFRIAQYERTGHPRREFCLSDGELSDLCRGPSVRLSVVDAHESTPGDDGHPPALAGVLARRG